MSSGPYTWHLLLCPPPLAERLLAKSPGKQQGRPYQVAQSPTPLAPAPKALNITPLTPRPYRAAPPHTDGGLPHNAGAAAGRLQC